MRLASQALIDHLATNKQFLMTDLYEITLVGGYVMRLTSYDRALNVNGQLYASMDVRRGRIRSSVGLEVDTLDLEFYPTASATINGVPFLSAVVRGALDSASIVVSKLFMPNPGDAALGAVQRFSGRISDISGDRDGVKAIAKSEIELLNAPFPPELFQASCLNTLYDAACGVNKVGYAVTGTVTSSTVEYVAVATATVLTLGVIKFTSGVNAGTIRAVRAHAGGQVYFAIPLIVPCASGDSFIAWPGCDKLLTTCSNKFSNQDNYRGFPFIPVPETLL